MRAYEPSPMPFLDITDRPIEYRMIPGDAARPALVLLHEGLGSMGLWRDFPDKVAARLGLRALVYSRFGYGQSGGLTAKRNIDFMHHEALEVLPRLLDQVGIEAPLLVGHSDGASIALIHAAAAQRPVGGLVLMAPHVFVEPVTVASITRMRETYRTSDLRDRLAKHHARVDDAFLGWADSWLSPEFLAWSIEPLLAEVRAPMLLIQGLDDEYATLEQLHRIAARAPGPITRLELAQCGHSPHRDQPAAVLDAVAAFARSLGI
ncbi:MAG: alpha/beta fold hydrolase [Hyphomicrobiaceae bacterium]